MDDYSGARARVTAFGQQLVQVHVWLRERLEDLRDDVDAFVAGEGVRPDDLRVHCLSFCEVLTRHHTGEDATAFPAIAAAHPELRAVITQLRTDHNHIDWMLGNLRRMLDDLPADPDPATTTRIQAELDGVSAVMETHFTYEEKKLRSLLDAMDEPGWRADRPGFLRTD